VKVVHYSLDVETKRYFFICPHCGKKVYPVNWVESSEYEFHACSCGDDLHYKAIQTFETLDKVTDYLRLRGVAGLSYERRFILEKSNPLKFLVNRLNDEKILRKL